MTDAARLEKNHAPRLSLAHVIKERYPTFVDALRDLDDALSMLFLFANLPSTTTVPPKTIDLCQRLCLEFQHYLIMSHSLRKSFLSIKGIYYQATVQGQDILWLVPYRFVQKVTGDVDFRIMGTFVELYTALVNFVNCRLYKSLGLIYPPKFNAVSDERGGDLRAIILESRGVSGSLIQSSSEAVMAVDGLTPSVATNGHGSAVGVTRTDSHLESMVREIAATEQERDPELNDQEAPENAVNTSIDTFDAPVAPDADVLLQPAMASESATHLFAPFVVYLSRETPRQPLEFLLRAFGCKRIGWDTVLGDGSFTQDEHDPSITHQVVDRPSLPMGAIAENGPASVDGQASNTISAVSTQARVPGADLHSAPVGLGLRQ